MPFPSATMRVVLPVGLAVPALLSGCGGTYDPDGTTARPATTGTTSSAVVTTVSTIATTMSTTLPVPTTTTLPTITTTTSAGPACPFFNGTHACYAGQPVDLSEKFVCGPNEHDGSPAVYPYSTTSCCAQGIRFNPSNQMCCYDGVHDYTDGYCAPWWDEFPTQCYCWAAMESSASTNTSSVVADEPVDTRSPPQSPCHYATAAAGCLNGYEFDYATQMPCGNYLIGYNSHGCCPTAGGFSPYHLKTQSCCQSGDGADKRYEVADDPHACTCRKYGCSGTFSETSV